MPNTDDSKPVPGPKKGLQPRRPSGAKPPETQDMLAMLLATGKFATKQVCELLNCSPAYISTMRRNPLFMAKVKTYQQTVYESVVDQALADVLADAPDNAQFMKDVRDGNVIDDPAAMGVRVRAAQTLYQTQFPKPKEEGKEGGVHITINADAKSRFETADDELTDIVEIDAEEMPE